MPTQIDWPLPSSRRRRRFVFLAAIIAVILFSGRTLLSSYVDLLWFRSLGYGAVFTRSLVFQWGIFGVFALVTFLIMYGCFAALKRAHLPDLPSSHTIFFGGQPVRLPVEPVMRLIAIGGSLAVAAITGTGMMAEWTTLVLYGFAPRAANQALDPVFGRPLSFFLFTLPAWQLISGWLLTIAFLTCIVAGVFLVIAGGAGALSRRRSFGVLPLRGLCFTSAFLLLILAIRVYIGRFDLILEGHTIFTGITYTDAHIDLTGMLLVSLALAAGAIGAAVNGAGAARGRWLIAAVAPAIVCFAGVQAAGWWVNSFLVKPNELVRERPYIANNIRMTRQAWGLDAFTPRDFPAETTVAAVEPANNQPTLNNIRLWDWRALQDTLRQIQEIRTYYDFPDIDIDRYRIHGELRQVMLGTRELNVEKLPESSRNWINEKLIYTHGYGVSMTPVNGFTPEGLPTLYLGNMPVQSQVPELKVSRPEIYFGELTDTDVYVNTRQQEFNYPQGEGNQVTSYQGNGGIVLGGFLQRILIAMDRGDIGKLPFSDDINAKSRLLMRRNVRDRVAALAPFLTIDSDPYMVVGEDGRLSWVIDAFTTSDQYPYSTHYRFGNDSINYMRNSVKVIIDAYDGSTTFYVFDNQDPILAAYRHVYPTLFRDGAAMPAAMRKHMRYPELLLALQGEAYGLYHMTDPGVFYNRDDLWSVAAESAPSEGGGQTSMPMQPNFVLMKLPGEAEMEFVGILPFTPANRNNMIGWIGARSDGAHYGETLVYNLPKNKLVDGPLQIEARIDQNPQLSGQLTLWNQQGSHVRRGTLLVIPVGRALLYAEPIYLQAERSPMPELRLVVLALQDRLAYAPTYEAALASLFQGAESSLSATNSAPNASPGASPGSAAGNVSEGHSAIREAADALAAYQKLTAEGKLGEAGKKLEELKGLIEKLNEKSPPMQK